MNYTAMNLELDSKLATAEGLLDKLAADLAEISFQGAELEYDILFTNRDYLQGCQRLVDPAEGDVAAEDAERIG